MSKWLLVLGANSEIAVATARRFAKEGWNLYLASRDMESLSREAANLHLRYGVRAIPFFFDSTDFVSHQKFYKSLQTAPLGVVVAFGFLGDQKNAQSNFSVAKEIIETNYVGAVSILEIVGEDYEARKSGFIVGISSVAGDRGRASNYIYGSAKSAFSTYLSGLRHRLFRSGVHVLTVKPGFVATKMTTSMDLPQRLVATPRGVAEDIFHAVSVKKDTIYTKKIWKFLMIIIKSIPEAIFKRMML